MEDLRNRISMKQAELARRLDVPYQYLWHVLVGNKIVSLERAIEIEEKTNGEIKWQDLRPDLAKLLKK